MVCEGKIEIVNCRLKIVNCFGIRVSFSNLQFAIYNFIGQIAALGSAVLGGVHTDGTGAAKIVDCKLQIVKNNFNLQFSIYNQKSL